MVFESWICSHKQCIRAPALKRTFCDAPDWKPPTRGPGEAMIPGEGRLRSTRSRYNRRKKRK
ncbi:Protein of unknown function [Gryllus bimaculatus]|nr:Protein of unknown function [Gryllus bimaculatus]